MNTNKRARRTRSVRMRRRCGRWWQRQQHQGGGIVPPDASDLTFSDHEVLMCRLLGEAEEAARSFDMERLGSIFWQLDAQRRQELMELLEISLWFSGADPGFWPAFLCDTD